MNQSPSHASSRDLIDGPPAGASQAMNSSWTMRVPTYSSSGAHRSASAGRVRAGVSVTASATTRGMVPPRSARSRQVRQLAPGRLGGALLGLLLTAALRAAVPDAGHHRPRGEHLGVVGSGLLDLVLRY